MSRQLSDKEKKLLENLNANPTINSGANFQDTDGLIYLKKPIGYNKINKIAVEVKATTKKSFSITKDIIVKMEKQASNNLATPILGLDISGKRYCVVQLDDFADILEWTQKNE